MEKIMCNCEHASHPTAKPTFADCDNDVQYFSMMMRSWMFFANQFPDIKQNGHQYHSVPAGEKVAWWVGEICDDCADTHMSRYIA